MHRFFVQAPHNAENCADLRAKLLEKGPAGLMHFDFACGVGDGTNHVAVAILDVGNETLAREAVPAIIRDEAIVMEVRKIVPEEVRAALESGQ